MNFRFLTAGESHGKALVGILEGLPSNLPLTVEYLYSELKRRKLGYGRGARQKIESDQVEILSGVRFGKTLGSPIALLILNEDWKAWSTIMAVEPQFEAEEKIRRQVSVPRPGHADWAGGIKYEHVDMRNVLERSSARETAMRVALGSVARRLLEELNIVIASRVVRIGSVKDQSECLIPIRELNALLDLSRVRCLDQGAESKMIEEIEAAKEQGDTLGGEVEVFAEGLPIGLGSYVQWDRRLEGDIAKAFMSLNAIKGVEIGLGFSVAALKGSQVHDELFPGRIHGTVHFETNHAGGIEGGMSTGQILCARVAMKPLSTLMTPLRSVNLQSGKPDSAHRERSDVCAVPSAGVICESLLALVLVEKILEKFGGDSLSELKERVEKWA